MKSRHVINRQVLEIQFESSESKAAELQNRIAEICRESLSKTMDELMDEMTGMDKFLRLDSVQIDIGTIRPDYLEKDLNEKVFRELHKVLTSEISKAKRIVNAKEDIEKRLDLIFYFLEHGVLPWWAQRDKVTSIESEILYTITNSPLLLIEKLKSLGRHDNVRRRLVFQFKEQTLFRIIHLLRKDHSDFIIEYINDTRMLYKERPFVSDSEQSFMNEVKYLVLSYLFLNKGYFEKKEFLKYQINGLAIRYGISYLKLLNFLSTAIMRMPYNFSVNSSFPGMIATLFREEKKETMYEEHLSNLDQEVFAYRSEMLWNFVAKGSLPWWEQSMVSLEELTSIFVSLLDSEKSVSINKLKELSTRFDAPKNLATIFPEEVLLKVVYASDPSSESFVRDYASHLDLVHKNNKLKGSTEEFGRLKWEVILSYFLKASGSKYNKLIFLKYTITKIAASYNIDYIELVNLLAYESKDRISSPRYPELLELLNELSQQNDAYTDTSEKSVHEAYNELNLTIYFIKNGKLPWYIKSIGEKELEHIIESSFKKSGDKIISLLNDTIDPDEVSERLVLYGKQTLQSLIKGKYKGEDGDLVNWVGETLELLKTKGKIFYTDKDKYTELLVFTYFSDSKLSLYEKLLSSLSKVTSIAIDELIYFIQDNRSEFKQLPKELKNTQEAEGSLFYESKKEEQKLENEEKSNLRNNMVNTSSEIAVISDYIYGNYQTSGKNQNLSEFISVELNRDYESLLDLLRNEAHLPTVEHLVFKEVDKNTLNLFSKRLIKGKLEFIDTFQEDMTRILVHTGIFKEVAQARLFLLKYCVWYSLKTSISNVNSLNFLEGFFSFLKKHQQVKDTSLLIEMIIKETPTIAAQLNSRLSLDIVKLYKQSKNKVEIPNGVSVEENKKDKSSPWIYKTKEGEKEVLESVFVTNAGLVLLWPFIKRYFEMTGIIKDNNFVSEETRNRGICLLQFLVTGTMDFEEYHLPLNKVLCGLDWHQPVESIEEVTQQEKDIAQGLLQAVIAQWSKIGNTSLEGLRSSFFLRQGKLAREKEQWTLKIEKKPFDMLLDHLPWSISMIKLPWMDKMLTVEWRQ